MIRSTLPDIVLSKRDYGRIERMVGGYAAFRRSKVICELEREIVRAAIVDNDWVSSDTATMGARVLFRDADTGREQVVTLVYPGEKSDIDDAVSLFTPVGVALLGLSEGQTITYETPDGRRKRLTLLKVLDQPTNRNKT